ncbi:MAG: molybdopterin-guanine dinucleotide biosynthesis protein B [Betaproteobacteria bacterium]|nr:molybdopterin-guanine dinucleotide biosynthesis protein B [Betaproteobacteria bacterium]
MKLFGFAGWSGSGKTTAIEQAIPHLRQAGLSVSLIKHAHHNFDIDQPGKDSWRHRRAGCSEVLITSKVRWALMHELHDEPELTLPQALRRLSPCDLVLVEGYKWAAIPRLEIHRPAIGKPLLFRDDPGIIGLATDAPDQFADAQIPVLDLSNAEAIAAFVIVHCTELLFDKLPPSL